jgi:hypothetical protein
MRAIRTAALALTCGWLAAIRAQEVAPEPPAAGPELDFLEYLGAWAEEDDEWLAIEEWQKGVEAEAGDEESEIEREDDDESD